MDDKTAFHPEPASGVTLAATQATGRVTLAGAGAASKAVRVCNRGPNDAFIEFGNATVVSAVATGMMLPSGNTEVFQTGISAVAMAAICNTGETAALYVTSGVGL